LFYGLWYKNMFSTKKESHNCCSPQPKGKVACPKCEQKAKGVLAKTLKHLLTKQSKESLICVEGFYYCKTPSCEVVYFRDDKILTQNALSVEVGLKDTAIRKTACYCFGWTKEKIAKDLKDNTESTVLKDIKDKMNTIGCTCEILNPSGGCCLADVGKVIKSLENT